MKGFARVLGAWGILTLIAGISPGSAVGQSALPPVPIMPSDPQGSFPDPGIPAAPSPPREPVGLDLRHLVGLFINESLGAGNQAAAVSYNDLYTRLLARSYGDPRPSIEVEYEFIQEILREYGDPADRFWDPQAFKDLLNRPRPPVQARGIGPRQVYLAVPDLTPATAQQIRQTHIARVSTVNIIGCINNLCAC